MPVRASEHFLDRKCSGINAVQTPEYQVCAGGYFTRGKHRRHQEMPDDVVDDLAVLLALGAAGDPVRIGLKYGPFLLAVGQRIPGDEIGQFLVGGADQRVVETGLLDAVLVPQFQRQRIEAASSAPAAGPADSI